jgi:hypothetical protein
LDYDNPKPFAHPIMGNFLIPGNIECYAINERNEEIASKLFRSTQAYGSYLGAKVGVYDVKTSFKGSAEYSEVRTEVFMYENFITESLYDQPLYWCKLYTENHKLESSAQDVIESGNNIVQRLGTHIVERVDIGGQVRVKASTDSCVLTSFNENEIKIDAKAVFWKMAIAGKGEVIHKTVDSCEINYSVSIASQSAKGGVLSMLSDKEQWYQSIKENPELIERKVVSIGQLVPSIDSSEIETYLEKFDTDDDINVDNAPPCPKNCEAGCFPANASILMKISDEINPVIPVKLEKLRQGDYVETQSGEFEQILFFSHAKGQGMYTFLEISTNVGLKLRLSKTHFIPVKAKNDTTSALVAARNVEVGDFLECRGQPCQVTDIAQVTDKGLYAPHTVSGKLIVDGVSVSCYTEAFPPFLTSVLVRAYELLSRISFWPLSHWTKRLLDFAVNKQDEETGRPLLADTYLALKTYMNM